MQIKILTCCCAIFLKVCYSFPWWPNKNHNVQRFNSTLNVDLNGPLDSSCPTLKDFIDVSIKLSKENKILETIDKLDRKFDKKFDKLDSDMQLIKVTINTAKDGIFLLTTILTILGIAKFKEFLKVLKEIFELN